MSIIKKNVILFLFFFIFFLPLIVSADMISLGFKGAGYCFKISNIENYPDYVFISSHEGYGGGGFSLIQQDDCIKPYFPETIFAIKKYDFEKINLGSEEQIGIFNGPYIPDGGDKDKQMELYEKKVETLFSNPGLLDSGIEMNRIQEISIFNNIKKIVDVLEIKSINESNFELVKSEVVYTYSSGRSDVVEYKNQDVRPKPTGTVSSYVIKFILTFLIEFFVILLFIRAEPKKLLLYSLIVNIITFPLATILYNGISGLVIIELGVFLVESVILMRLLKIKYAKAVLISFVANVITAIIGLFL